MIASLRGRLVAGVLALAAAGMLLVGGITYATQRSFQLDRVDTQLASAVDGLQREFIGRHGGDAPVQGRRGGPPPGGGAPSDTYGQLRDTSGNVLDDEFLGPDDTGEAPDLPKDIPVGEEMTVETPQGDYRVLAAELRPQHRDRRRDPDERHRRGARAACCSCWPW